jgi:hypothetical protein
MAEFFASWQQSYMWEFGAVVISGLSKFFHISISTYCILHNFRVKFEPIFLGKYADDFKFKNMLRISKT